MKTAASFIPIPARTPESFCRSCGQMIYWAPHPSTGKRHPVSIKHDEAEVPTPFHEGKGISHFADCPDAEQHRRARK